jgi:hypothetical protein
MPRLLGATLLDGTGRDVETSGVHGYVAAGLEGIHVVDLRDPTAPVLVATVGADWGYSTEVAVTGNLLVASTTLTGLHFVDISTPASPREIAELPLVKFGSGMEFSGGSLWTVGRPDLNPDDFFGFDPVGDYLVRVDVSRLDAPEISEVIEIALLATDMRIQDGTAFVTTSNGARGNTPDPALAMINLETERVRSTTLPSEPVGVAVDGLTVVVNTERAGLLVLDLGKVPLEPTTPLPPRGAYLPQTHR